MTATIPTVLAHALVQVAPPQSVVHQIVKAPMVLAGVDSGHEHGAVRLVRGVLSVFAPDHPNSDKVTLSINVHGHMVEEYDSDDDCWYGVCPVVDFLPLPSAWEPYAISDRAAIAIAKAIPVLPVCDPVPLEYRRAVDRIFLQDRDAQRLSHPFPGEPR